ncbi:MAG: prepilin peptidase [Planctomycetaceae bacterium]
MNWLLLIPALLCAEAVWHDVKEREIPDSIPLRVLATGLLVTATTWHVVTFYDALAGVAIGFLAVLPFTLRGGIGGGDLKLVASLGAWLGITGTVSLLFWTAIAGLGVATLTHLRGRKDFPYAPAILAGLLVTILLPGALNSLLELLRR